MHALIDWLRRRKTPGPVGVKTHSTTLTPREAERLFQRYQRHGQIVEKSELWAHGINDRSNASA